MAVPPPDYFSFRRLALDFAQLLPPSFFKRAPAYPLLMALGRLVAPGPDPYLYAAEAANLLAAFAVAALVYGWARRYVGRGALLAVALVALHSQFLTLATIPLCEMAYTAFILAAVATAGRGTGWAYLWAGAAAATRYEALLLVPLVALADAGRWRRQPALLAYALLAAAPMAAWLAASYVKTSLFNPYVEEIAALNPSGVVFPRELLASFVDLRHPVWLVVAGAFAALTLLGWFRLARTDAAARVYLAFGVAYAAVHIIFPFAYRRFVWPVWPLVAVGMTAGGRELWRWVAARRPRPGIAWAVAGAGAAALAAAAVWRLAVARPAPWGVTLFAFVVPVAFVAAAAAWATSREASASRRVAATLSATLVLALYLDANARFMLHERRTLRTAGVAVKEAAAWLKSAGTAADTVVTGEDALYYYYMQGDGPWVLPVSCFPTRDFARFTAALRHAGVTYVCYDSTLFSEPSGYFADRAGVNVLRPLAAGRDQPPYYLVGHTTAPREYVYIYRLAAEPDGWLGPTPADAPE